MKCASVLKFAVGLFTVAVVVGCAEIPQKEIDTAQTALEEATKAEADRYAPVEFMAARDSLHAAMAEIDRAKSQFPLLRSFGEAIQKLQSATLAANHALGVAKVNKERAQNETSNFLKQARAAVDRDKVLLQQAPKGKDGRAVVVEIQNDLATVEAAIAAADSVRRTGDYLTARDKANACLTNAKAIGQELKDAIDKKKARSSTKGRGRT
ncbi:MAG: hypothetical protein ONB44_01415 [candidate division KSB1 bacterium]|nr:hypothetical protein [candidate division KSB1 bacterium]MDZ7309951.1 hypothetical protein [candidate division KSB1 bacterium]